MRLLLRGMLQQLKYSDLAMLGWKVAAQVLVFLGAMLSLPPIITRFQAFLRSSRHRVWFEFMSAVGFFMILGVLVLPSLQRRVSCTWFTQYIWWKLALEAFLFLFSVIAVSFRFGKSVRAQLWDAGPFLLTFAILLAYECKKYTGQLFYLSFLSLCLHSHCSAGLCKDI